jgi:hypothetical protein
MGFWPKFFAAASFNFIANKGIDHVDKFYRS